MITFVEYIIFISSYSIIHFILSLLNISYNSIYSISINIFFWIIVFLFLKKKNSLINYNFCLPKSSWLKVSLLLFIMPILQLIIQGIDKLSLIEVVSLLLSVLTEEFAFRVVLTKILKDEFNISNKLSIILSSLIFAAFHIISPNYDLSISYIIFKLLFAFCSGCALCVLTQNTGSLLPSVILHFLINIVSTPQVLNRIQIISTIIISLVFISYTIINFQKRIITHETIY